MTGEGQEVNSPVGNRHRNGEATALERKPDPRGASQAPLASGTHSRALVPPGVHAPRAFSGLARQLSPLPGVSPVPGTLWPRLSPAPALGPRVRASLTPAFLPDPHFLYSGVPSPGPARSASHGSFARAPRLQGSATPSGCAGTAPPRPDQRPTSVPPWSRCRRCVRGARAPVCRDTGALPSEVCSPAGAPPGPCARPGQPPRRVEGGGARELDPPVRRRPRRTRPREAETRARATSAAGPSPPRSGLAAPGLRAIHPQPPGPSATAVPCVNF